MKGEGGRVAHIRDDGRLVGAVRINNPVDHPFQDVNHYLTLVLVAEIRLRRPVLP